MDLLIKNVSPLKYYVVSIIIAVAIGGAYTYFRPNFAGYFYVIAGFVFFSAVLLKVALSSEKRTNRNFAWLTIPLLMVIFWKLIHAMFSDFNIHAILYHLKYGFTSNGVPTAYVELGLIVLVATLLIGATLCVLVRQYPIVARLDSLCVVPLVLLNPLVLETVEGLGLTGTGDGILKNEYRYVQSLSHDGSAKKNIIHIFLESAERTLSDEQQFGPLMRPVMPLEARGFHATDLRQVKSTDWTMAGMVSATCGVPLIQPWLVESRNTTANIERFLPNSLCLGDVLKKDGYQAHYIMGAHIDFAGTGNFYRDHGYDSTVGFEKLIDLYDSKLGDWGLSDFAVFNHAERKIRELSASEDNFIVTVSSIGGHGPEGMASPECLNGTVPILSSTDLGIGGECANKIVRTMLDRLEKDGLLENTIVVIQSDHLLMGGDFQTQLRKMERRNFFTLYGPDVPRKSLARPAAMMDIYPTILDALGYEVPQRIGLGTSLLSGHSTLIEEMGEEGLNNAIQYDHSLRKLLWAVTDKNLLTADIE